MTDRARARVAALRLRLLEELLDGLVISSLANTRYYTGFSGSNAMVVVTQRDVTLLTDFRYEVQARQECPAWVQLRVESTSLWSGLWDVLGQMPSTKTVGYESAHLVHRDFQRCLEQGDRWHWRPTIDYTEDLRTTKDADEIALIKRAGAVATNALSLVLPRIKCGMSELEICGVLEHELRIAGSEAHPFPPIVAAGERSALPHASPSGRPSRRGEFLLLDFGATVGGYCSDITRTFVLGAATLRHREVYDVVREAHELAAAGLRAGMSGKEGDAIAREAIGARGFGDAFGHSLGHGVGLEVHEAPRLSRLAEGLLPEGAVVTIEPGVYVPGWGGVRLEDDVRILANGVEFLTEFPRELIELGN